MAANIEQKILDFLQSNNQGAPALQIAKHIGHSRITVGKYLDLLEARKVVQCRTVGQANLWTLYNQQQQKKILIVDDEEPVVNLISLCLDGDYEQFRAYNGQEALELVAKHNPDLVICDIMMPQKDGFEVCSAIKSNVLTEHITVILLSAKNQVEDKVKGFEAGADYYMEKPFDPQELSALVQTKLRSVDERTSKHPVTNLPLVSSTLPKLQPYKNDESFTFCRMDLKGFDEFVEKAGYKQATYVLEMVGKLIEREIEKLQTMNSFLGMAGDSVFIVALQKDVRHLQENIVTEFTSSLPFLNSMSSCEMCSKLLKLEFAHGALDDLLSQ